MGSACSAATVLAHEPVGKGTLAASESIASNGVATKPISMKARTSPFCWSGKSETVLVDTVSGATLYRTQAVTIFTTCTITVTDASGNLVCVAKGKRQLTAGTFHVMRPWPAFAGQEASDAVTSEKATGKKDAYLLSKDGVPLYAFAEGKIKMGLGTASCEYGLVKKGEQNIAPLFEAKKLRSLGFAFRVESGGTLVGKIAQTGIDPSKVALEVGAGVDPVALILMTGFVAAITGSGGGASVGGLAGAGVV